MWDLIAIPFVLVFIAEFGDKSQLVTLSFTAEGTSPIKVLLGVVLGLGGVTLLGVIGGSLLYTFVPTLLIEGGVTIVFLGVGVYVLFELARNHRKMRSLDPDPTSTKPTPPEGTPSFERKTIATVALTLFAMEFGDKTQLLIIVLVASATYPILVGLACFSGLIAVNAIVILFGKTVNVKISPSYVRAMSGILFLIFGVFSAWSLLLG